MKHFMRDLIFVSLGFLNLNTQLLANPSLIQFPKNLSYNVQATNSKVYRSMRENISKSITASKLGLATINGEMLRPFISVDTLATSPDGSKFIIGVIGASTDLKLQNKLLVLNKLQVYHTKENSNPIAIGFYNLNSQEIEKFLESFKSKRVSYLDSSTSTFLFSFSILGNKAYAEEIAEGVSTSDIYPVTNLQANQDTTTMEIAKSFASCGKGLGHGAVDILKTPDKILVQPVIGLVNGMSDPQKYWNDTVIQTKALWAAARDFRSVVSKHWQNYWSMSPADQSEFNCRVGTPILLGMYTRSLAGGASLKVEAETRAAMDSAVRKASTEKKSVDTLGSVVLPKVIPKDMLLAQARELNPPTFRFAKDQPTLAYKITSDRFEDIPPAIRNSLGAIDSTKYTPEYLRQNIGSVIALQMKEGQPDFYIIGLETFKSKYAVVSAADVAAKNGKYLGSLQQAAPGIDQSTGVVAVLKKTPTDMIKMSDLGYKVDQRVVIESPWGQQTKPSGQDAFLVFDPSKNQYYMVNAGNDGNPLSYVPLQN